MYLRVRDRELGGSEKRYASGLGTEPYPGTKRNPSKELYHKIIWRSQNAPLGTYDCNADRSDGDDIDLYELAL